MRSLIALAPPLVPAVAHAADPYGGGLGVRGLRGSAIEWTADNHYRRTTSYKVYRWDAAANSVAPIGDWTHLEVNTP